MTLTSTMSGGSLAVLHVYYRILNHPASKRSLTRHVRDMNAWTKTYRGFHQTLHPRPHSVILPLSLVLSQSQGSGTTPWNLTR